MRSIGATIVLFVLWLLMSGLWDKWLVVLFGAISSIIAIWVLRRMDAVDGDQVEIRLNPVALIRYNIWLMGEVAKANWAVTKVIVAGTPLRQHLFYTTPSQTTDLGRVIFANSITLTPGTISVEAHEGKFLVHALDFGDTDKAELAEMDRQVSTVERN